jgi:hypothetical protein
VQGIEPRRGGQHKEELPVPQMHRHKGHIALLKGSCGCGEEHEIVSEDTQDEFAPLSLVSSRGQR